MHLVPVETFVASLALTVSFDPAINYAFQQSAIAFVRELRFQNDDIARKDLVLRVTVESAFAAPVEIRLQGIAPLGEYCVVPLELKLSHDFLADLNNKISCWLKTEVLDGETVLCTRFARIHPLPIPGKVGTAATSAGSGRLAPDETVLGGRDFTDPVETPATPAAKTDSPRRSYGVVTFIHAQQKLVEDLLDQKRPEHTEIELHIREEPPVEGEPAFVKNLESIQDHERDVILISICYDRHEIGKISMDFDSLNRDGAKREVLVYNGLRDLKYFLDYGPKAPAATTMTSGEAVADSELEKMVADCIRKAGYDVHHQVGCSGYGIDHAVVDPAAPRRFHLGIECNGATYYHAVARARDNLRQLILEGLGWKLHRLWSTDWWHDAVQDMDKLRGVLRS